MQHALVLWLLVFALGCRQRVLSYDAGLQRIPSFAAPADVPVVAEVADAMPTDFWCYVHTTEIFCFTGPDALNRCEDDPNRPNEAPCAPF